MQLMNNTIAGKMRFTISFLALFACLASVSLGKLSSAIDEASASSSTGTATKSKSSPSSPTTAGQATTALGKVLFVAAVGTKSHKNFYNGIIDALANAGYEVTVLTPYHPTQERKNVREIIFEGNDIALHAVNPFQDGKLAPFFRMPSLGATMCLNALGSEVYSEVLKENFDIAFVSLFLNDCFMGHVNAWNIPFVLVSPAELIGPFSEKKTGNPSFPSFDYNPMLAFPQPMSFGHRFISTVGGVFLSWTFEYITYHIDSEARAKGLLAPDTPCLSSIFPNASLVIANSFRLAEHPRPYMPNILLAGGIHLQPSKPLPKDLEEWVQSSGDAGFIFFSLGSAVRASDVPLETIKVLLSVFKTLKQKVLWKFNLPDVGAELPPNVQLTTWAPQQDLLGDPRIRLFITHGGLHSTQEAIYHGVPILGIPVFGDQEGNIVKAVSQGWGLKLGWTEVTYDNLTSSILSLIDGNVYREKVSKVGALMRDRPTNPADDVVWWTGYILRTGGAHHLKSGAINLPWYKLYNADVWAVVVLVVLSLLWVDYKILRTLYRRCCGRPVRNVTSKKHKQQ